MVTNDPALAERIEAIAHPGLTANFDAGKTAAMAITMLDWLVHGRQYAADMVTAAADLARGLEAQDLPVHRPAGQPTQVSHQLALEASGLAPELVDLSEVTDADRQRFETRLASVPEHLRYWWLRQYANPILNRAGHVEEDA